MEFLTQLWIPIVVSAALVWVIGAVIWMAMPHRKNEWKPITNEVGFIQSVKSFELAPGFYSFPHCGDGKRMKEESFQVMLKEGPIGTVHVWHGMRSMGMCMIGSFVFYLVTSVFVAYLGWNAFEGRPAPTYLDVFQITATAAFMAYSFALIPIGIWFHKPVKNMVFDVVDGLVMGLATGGVFGWLWPSMQSAMDANITGGIGG